MIAVVILAPTPVARAGLRSLLTAESSGLQVVAEAGTSSELADLVAAVRPDVLLLDPSPLDDEIFEALPNLTAEHPALRVVVLGAGGEVLVAEALRAGASGYLGLNASGAALAAAVQAVAQGLTVLDPAAAVGLLERAGAQATAPLPSAMPAPALTVRELEVLQLLAEGLTNRGIAARLDISEHTAKFHVSAVLSKFGAGSRAEAVALAARQGLILL